MKILIKNLSYQVSKVVRNREHRRENLLSPPSGDSLPRVFFFLCAFLFSSHAWALPGAHIADQSKCENVAEDYAYHGKKVMCVMDISCEGHARFNKAARSPKPIKARACCRVDNYGLCPDVDICVRDSSISEQNCSSLKKLGYCPTRPSSSSFSKPSTGAQ